MKIALVRGAGLSKYEMQSYEPLLDRYKMVAFALEGNLPDVSTIKIPVRKLKWKDSWRGRSITNAFYARILGMRYYMPGLESELKDFDIVHSAEIKTSFSYQVARAKKKYGFKMVVTSTENIPFPGWESEKVVRMKEVILKNTDFFLALTERAKNVLLLEGISEEKIRVVPLGVDLSRFYPQKKDKELLKKMGIDEKEVVVLFVGRFVWEKGIYDLLTAASLLKDLKFIFVGDGPEKESMRSYIKRLDMEERVRILDLVSYQEIPSIYSISDLVVLPSLPLRGLQEQFGMILIEAMACQKPVIGTYCGSIPEVIKEGGILVLPGDYVSLAREIKRLADDRDLRSSIAEKGRRLAGKRYDASKVALQIGEIYENL